MDKALLRQRMKAARAGIGRVEREKSDSAIRDRLMSMDRVKIADWIYTYVSYGTEVDTIRLIEKFFKAKKNSSNVRVAAPRVEGDEMEFYEITSMADLALGYNKIPEPDPSRCKKARPDFAFGTKGIVMLMPGLAFDLKFGRVGYGGGFYDRYLARRGSRDIYKIALAYDFQVLKDEFVETEAHDMRPDAIATDRKIYEKANDKIWRA